MLVKLYELPDIKPSLTKTGNLGIQIRRPDSREKRKVISWVSTQFGDQWARECEVSFSRLPPSCYIAVESNEIIGFACFDCTAKNFFGPSGVAEPARGNGVGKVLLLCCLDAMKRNGYGYAIIGGVGPADFYAKTVGAQLIEGSNQSIYGNNVRK